jgi:hypothetical protein
MTMVKSFSGFSWFLFLSQVTMVVHNFVGVPWPRHSHIAVRTFHAAVESMDCEENRENLVAALITLAFYRLSANSTELPCSIFTVKLVVCY